MANTELPVPQSSQMLMAGENYSEPAYNMSFENTTIQSGTTINPKMSILLASMFVAGVFGNILAIIVLARSSREHKQTVFYRLVGALACTDLFGTCAVSPISLLVYTRTITLIPETALCNYNGFMFIFAGCATILIIGAMAIERYLAIRCPFFYDKHMRVGRAKYVIVSMWGFAVFMGCLPIFGLGEIVVQFPRTWCFFTFTSASISNKIFAYSYASIGLFVISLTIISNVFVTLTLIMMRQKSRKLFNTIGTKRTYIELQMMVLLLGVVVVFSFCWCPFLIRIIINQVREEQRGILADLNALKLASLNQILDPWVYILFRKELFFRWFYFLKTKVFYKCIGPCTEEREQATVLVDHRNGNEVCKTFVQENGVLETKYKQIQRDTNQSNITSNNSDKDMGTYSERDSNHSYKSPRSRIVSGCEEVPLRDSQYHGCDDVHMRHSVCLFCLANRSKRFTITATGDSKSMDYLHSCAWHRGDRALMDERIDVVKINESKRNVSYTDLGLKHACKCESNEPCVSLEC